MSEVLIDAAEATGEPALLYTLREAELEVFLEGQPPLVRRWVQAAQFKAKAGQAVVVPTEEDGPDLALFGLGEGAAADGMAFRALPAKLPAADYRLAAAPEGVALDRVALAWALGAYGFDRYRKTAAGPRPRLEVPPQVELAEVKRMARACALARDLINTPPNDMGPVQLEMAAREVAEVAGAEIAVVTGEALLEENYPAVHAVGRAADPTRAPRMIEIAWRGPGAGDDAPLIALVGK